MLYSWPGITWRHSLAFLLFAAFAVHESRTAAEPARPAETSPTREAAGQSGLHQILRIYLPLEHAQRRTDEVIDYCRRTGCREVLLFTTSYDQAPSFHSLAEIESYVAAIRPQAECLRAAGITVSVNVLQTLGHVYFPKAMSEQFPFQRRVFFDGHVSTEGACPLCPELRRWVAGAYAIYARLKPPVLFVDDDYRTMMAGGMSCFCPRHLDEIGRLAGRKVTREEVVRAIHSGDGANPLRRHYYEVTSRGFEDLAAIIHREVTRVSPETHVGLMTASWPTGAQGVDLARVAAALAGPQRPMIRPQIPFYSEGFLRDAPAAFLNPCRLRAVLPPTIEYWPEIENYQYSLYAKSARCTLTQMTVCVLCGFDHLALNVFDMYGSPLADSEPLIHELESGRKFLDRLHAMLPEGSRPEGVAVFEHADQLRVRCCSVGPGDLFSSARLADRLPALGLPITFGRSSPWHVICGDDVLALDDQALNALLSRGALLDATAAEALQHRGLAARIGVEVAEAIPLDDLGYESFDDKDTSPELNGRCFPLRPLVSGGDWRRLKPRADGSRAASQIHNYRRDVVAPSLLLSENSRGERFAVLAFSGRGDRHLLENLMRAEQLRQVLGWIARRPLPVAAHYDAPYLWLILNRSRNGQAVIGVVNLSSDVYQTLPLIFDRKALPGRLLQIDTQGQSHAVAFDEAPSTDGTVRRNIHCRLEPFEVAAFVCETP